MKKVITTMLVAAMVLSMAVPTSAATITRKKTASSASSSTKVTGDYSLKMVDKTLQFVRGGKVVSSIDTKDAKVTLRKNSKGGISAVFTDSKGKRRNITLGKQDSVSLNGTFVQVSVDKALGNSFEVTLEKGSKVTSLYAKGAAKVIVNGTATTLNATASNANVTVNGTVTKAYAVSKGSISGLPTSKITQTSTGTSSSGSITSSSSSSSSNNSWGNSSNTGGSVGGGVVGEIIGGGTTNKPSVALKTVTLKQTIATVPTHDQGTKLSTINPETVYGLKATYNGATVAGKFSFSAANGTVLTGENSYSVMFTPTQGSVYNKAYINVKINGKAVATPQTLAQAKAAVESVIAGLGVNNDTTEAGILAAAKAVISNTSIETTAAITVVKAEVGKAGSVKGTITLKLNGVTETITVNKEIPALSALTQAKAAIEAAVAGMTVTNDTANADVEKIANDELAKYTGITHEGAWTVSKIAATAGTAGSIKLTGTIKDAAGATATIDATVVIAALPAEGKAPVFLTDLDGEKEDVVLNPETPRTLTVKASVDGTTEKDVTYTWYRTNVNNTEDPARVVVGTGNSYTISTSDVKNAYYNYFVIASTNVEGKEYSATSKVKLMKVTLMEGAAEIPIVDVTTKSYSYTLGNNPADLAVNVTGVTPGTSALTYEWYKADSVDAVGEKVGTAATYKPSTAKAGLAYYYCKVTNTDSAATSIKSVTTTSDRITVKVTAIGSMATSTREEDATTTAIDVKFSPALPIDFMTSLKATDFSITGDTADCTLKLSGEAVFTDSADTIRLYVTGVHIGENATLKLLKDTTETGITVSNKTASVSILKKAEVAVPAKVVSIEAVENKSAAGKVLDTKEVKVTFDKALDAAPAAANIEFTMADKITKVTATGTPALSADKKTVTGIEIALPKAGTTATEVLTLTKFDTAIDEADQKTVTVNRDIEAPTVISAILHTDSKTIQVQFDEPLAGTGSNGFTVKDSLGDPVTVASSAFAAGDTSMVNVTLDAKVDENTKQPIKVTYDSSTGDLTDVSVKENALAGFSVPVVSTVIEKLAIASVSAPDTSTPTAPVLKVELNDKVDVKGSGPIATDLFTVKGPVSGKTYTVASITQETISPRARSAMSMNGFTITISGSLDARDTYLSVSINVNSEAAKDIVSVSKPDQSLGNAESQPTVTPEVLEIKFSAAAKAGEKTVEVTLANSTFAAEATTVGNWTVEGGTLTTVTLDTAKKVATLTMQDVIAPDAKITVKPLAEALVTTDTLKAPAVAQNVVIAADPAPAAPTATSAAGANEGETKITGLVDATTYEYIANTTATAPTDWTGAVEKTGTELMAKTTFTDATHLHIRVKATGTAPASEVQSLKIVVKEAADPAAGAKAELAKITAAALGDIAVTKDADAAAVKTAIETKAKTLVDSGYSVVFTAGSPAADTATVAKVTQAGTFKVTSTTTETDTATSASIDVSLDVQAAEATKITAVTVETAVQPVINTALVAPTITADAEKFAIGEVSWSDSGTTGSNAAAGTAYTATITLTAKSGYTFTGMETSGITNSGSGTVSIDGTPGATLVIKIAFPATAAADAAEVTVTAIQGSVAGETAVSATAVANGVLKYKTSNASIATPKTTDTEPSDVTNFTTGSGIAITDKDTYVHVYEISGGKVVGYGEHLVAGSEIKPSIEATAIEITPVTTNLKVSEAVTDAKVADLAITGKPEGSTVSITGTDSADFKLNAGNTEIQCAKRLTEKAHTIVVTVTDANGATVDSTSATITIAAD